MIGKNKTAKSSVKTALSRRARSSCRKKEKRKKRKHLARWSRATAEVLLVVAVVVVVMMIGVAILFAMTGSSTCCRQCGHYCFEGRSAGDDAATAAASVHCPTNAKQCFLSLSLSLFQFMYRLQTHTHTHRHHHWQPSVCRSEQREIHTHKLAFHRLIDLLVLVLVLLLLLLMLFSAASACLLY